MGQQFAEIDVLCMHKLGGYLRENGNDGILEQIDSLQNVTKCEENVRVNMDVLKIRNRAGVANWECKQCITEEKQGKN